MPGGQGQAGGRRLRRTITSTGLSARVPLNVEGALPRYASPMAAPQYLRPESHRVSKEMKKLRRHWPDPRSIKNA